MNFNDNNPMSFSARAETTTMDMGLRSYMLSVYNYMASAVALTGIFAYLTANYAPLMNALYTVSDGRLHTTALGWLITFAPFGFIIALNMGLNRMSMATIQALFWGFAAIIGMSLSTIFLAYTGTSIVRIFFITSIMFGSMSIWGYTTKKDLTGMGHFMMMGLYGIIAAIIINFFMQSSALQFAISILCVVIFTGLTAYDTQKIKGYYYQTMGDVIAAGKSAVMGALNLYLDFLNIFLSLLQLFGDRR